MSSPWSVEPGRTRWIGQPGISSGNFNLKRTSASARLPRNISSETRGPFVSHHVWITFAGRGRCGHTHLTFCPITLLGAWEKGYSSQESCGGWEENYQWRPVGAWSHARFKWLLTKGKFGPQTWQSSSEGKTFATIGRRWWTKRQLRRHQGSKVAACANRGRLHAAENGRKVHMWLGGRTWAPEGRKGACWSQEPGSSWKTSTNIERKY